MVTTGGSKSRTVPGADVTTWDISRIQKRSTKWSIVSCIGQVSPAGQSAHGQSARHRRRHEAGQIASSRVGERLEERHQLVLLCLGQLERGPKLEVERLEDVVDRCLVAVVAALHRRRGVGGLNLRNDFATSV